MRRSDRPDGPDPADDGAGANILGRVTDPAALDAERGTTGHIDLCVPAAWSGRRVRVRVPRRLPCARCGGGGCDRCGRSGAVVLRAGAYRDASDGPGSGGASFEMALPDVGAKPVLIRVPRPFGDDAGLDQLHVVVESGPTDPRVTLADGGVPAQRAIPHVWIAVGVAVLLALVAVLRLAA